MWVWIRFGNCTFVSWLMDEDGPATGGEVWQDPVLCPGTSIYSTVFSPLTRGGGQSVPRTWAPSDHSNWRRKKVLGSALGSVIWWLCSLHHNNQPHTHTTLLTSPSLRWQGQHSIVSASRPIRLLLQNKSSPIRPTPGPPLPPLAPAFFPGREMC